MTDTSVRGSILSLAILAHSVVLLPAADKPNVLFICIDDLVPTLGCYGDTTAQTPEIDDLASQGTTFLNHHCTWAVCGPSRVALTTSLTPEETGVMGFRAMRHPDNLPDVITLPQHFKDNGYETACTGKFHDPRTVGHGTIGANNQFPSASGKDDDDLASWSIHYVRAASGFATPKVTVDAGGANEEADVHVAWDDADQADSLYADHKILTEGKTLVTTISGGSKPFFLAVGFKKPHLAFVAPKRMWDKYTRANMPLASFSTLPINVSSTTQATLENNSEINGYADPEADGGGIFQKYSASIATPISDEKQRALIHGYYASTSWVDFLVGDLLDHLATTDDPIQESSPGVKKKMSETTIIVLWGDHGFHLGDHGKWAKHTGMERSTSCPLIVFDPRSPNNGAKTNTPINTLDIFPTLCELAELPIPLQPMDNTANSTGRPLRGTSFVPVLKDSSDSVNVGAINVFQRDGNTGYSYRTERFRYIEWVKNSTNVVVGRDLYDYTSDPLETRNVATDSGYEAILYQLSRALRADTATQGATHLQASTPISTGGGAYLPFTKIENGTTSGSAILSWPQVGGQTFELLSNTDLSSSWPAFTSDLTENSHDYTIPVAEDRRFFRVAIGSNTPPQWDANPLVKDDASAGASYTGSIASDATDADAGDSITFSKIDGPDWLIVASNGSLSGTGPASESADYFTIKVSDDHGAETTAKLQITVKDSNTVTTFEKTDDSFVKESAATTNFNDRTYIELRQSEASSFQRLGYVKYTVAGVNTVSSARLFFRISSSATNPELDSINVLAVSDTVWTESSLIWNNRPTTGSVLGSTSGAADEWVSVDVTSHVTGNGTFAFALDEQGNSVGKIYAQNGSVATTNAPYLEVTWN